MSVDFNKPYDWFGGTERSPDYIIQGGVLYAWSESNIQYERAWWLYATADDCPLTRHLRETRPIPNDIPEADRVKLGLLAAKEERQ